MQFHKRTTSVLLCLLCSLCASASGDMLCKLGEYPSDKLMEIGVSCLGRSVKSDSAMVCFAIVSNRYYDGMSREDKFRCVAAMNDLAVSYTYGHINYPQAHRYLIRALALAEENTFSYLLSAIYNNLGNLYYIYGRQLELGGMLTKAEEMYLKAYRQSEQIKNYYLQCCAFINIMDTGTPVPLDQFSGIFDKRIPASTNSLAHARMLYKAVEAERSGHYALARQYYQKMIPAINQKFMPEVYVSGGYVRIGNTYADERNYAKALAEYRKAMDVAAEHHNLELSINAIRQMEKVRRLMGDNRAADSLHVRLLTQRDSLVTAFGLNNIAEMSFKHELQQAEDKTQQLVSEKRVRRAKLYMVSVLLAVAVAFLLFVVRKNRQLWQRNKKLYEKNVALLHAEDEDKASRDSAKSVHKDVCSVEKYNASKLCEDEKLRLLDCIRDIMQQSDVICNSEFSLQQLAKLVGSNKTYVSQVINEKYGKTFNMLLGDSRVKEACRRIDDHEHYGQYTLESISESVGFRSRTTFTTSFKRLVGLTPSEYLRLSRGQK